MKNLKRQELMNLEQSNMTVLEYEQWFISLSTFVSHLNLLDKGLAKMFENRLHPWIKGPVAMQHLRTLGDVF